MPAPIVSAVVQATALACVSNILAQALDHWRKNEAFAFSIPDFLRFALLNLIVAPPNFLWQSWLERTFPARPTAPVWHSDALEAVEMGHGVETKEKGGYDEVKAEGRFSWPNTLKKWVVDCFTVGALVNTVVFLAIMNVMKGKTLPEVTDAVRAETLPIIFAGYRIWPIASILSFTFIPVEKRIVFLSFVGLIWGIYLSIVAARQ